jgi:hypothetical protein
VKSLLFKFINVSVSQSCALSPRKRWINPRLVFTGLVVEEVLVFKLFFQYFGFTLLQFQECFIVNFSMNDAMVLETDRIVTETHVRLEHKRKVLGSHSTGASST